VFNYLNPRKRMTYYADTGANKVANT